MSKVHPLLVNCETGKLSFDVNTTGCWHSLRFCATKHIKKVDKENASTAAQYFKALHKAKVNK